MWIGLTEPRLKVLRAEESVSSCVVRAEASHRCLHLLQFWDVIVIIEGVNVGDQLSAMRVGVFSLVEDVIALGDIINVVPRRVGRSGRRVLVIDFEDFIIPMEVLVYHYRFKEFSNICCHLL